MPLMQCVWLVRRLCIYIARLGDVHTSNVGHEGKFDVAASYMILGLDAVDISAQLAKLLEKEFWSMLLGSCIHLNSLIPLQYEHKRLTAKRFEIDSLLQSMEKNNNTLMARVTRTCKIPMKPTPAYLDKTTSDMNFVLATSKYQHDVMLKKNLCLEAASLECLLEAYWHISHIPFMDDGNKHNNVTWIPFEYNVEVLCLLLHLSQPPISCIDKLALARLMLRHCKVSAVQNMELKLLLDRTNTQMLNRPWSYSAIGLDDSQPIHVIAPNHSVVTLATKSPEFQEFAQCCAKTKAASCYDYMGYF